MILWKRTHLVSIIHCPWQLLQLLFIFSRSVHSVCLWDEKGANKVHQALHEDILDFIKQAQAVRIHYIVINKW